MVKATRSLLGLLLVLLVSSAGAQDTLTSLERTAVDKAIKGQIIEQQLVGIAVGIIRDGKIVYLQGFGAADRENNVPVTTDTMFRWASVSKPVTAVAAMQLVDQGKLDLSADVRTYVPEFPDKGATITPRDLMCHQSGIVHYTNGRVIRTNRDYRQEHPFRDVVLALDRFKESPLVNQPGEKYSYSTHAYILLSAVVQRAGNQAFADQVQERISQPLGITTLQPDYQWQDIEHRALGYRKFAEKIRKSSNTDVSWKLGGGGFISSIEGMAKFAAGLVNGKLVSQSAYEQMWAPQKTKDGKATTMGLGFSVEGSGDDLKISHNGSQEKTRTRLVIFPRQKTGVVVMTNSEYANPVQITTAVWESLEKRKFDW